MINMIKAGTKCRVLADSMNNFNSGDIVVALENSLMPFCCLLEDYDPNKSIYDYNPNLFDVLYGHELEVLDDRTEK